MPDQVPLGARVRAARLSRNLTLRALAEAVEVSPATLSQIENGHTGISVARLGRIADALAMAVSDVLDMQLGEPVPMPPQPGPAPVRNWRRYPPLDLDPVLRAALAEFVEVGYHGATVRGIAQRCGLSVSGLYHYHPSKQELLRGILDHTMSDLLARSNLALAEGGDPVSRFSLLVENLALFHTHRRELGFVGASEMRSLEPANRQVIAKLRNVQQHMLDDEVTAAVREGSFRTGHPRSAARAVATMCTALPTWWRPGGALSAEQVAVQYVGFALDLVRYVDHGG